MDTSSARRQYLWHCFCLARALIDIFIVTSRHGAKQVNPDNLINLRVLHVNPLGTSSRQRYVYGRLLYDYGQTTSTCTSRGRVRAEDAYEQWTLMSRGRVREEDEYEERTSTSSGRVRAEDEYEQRT